VIKQLGKKQVRLAQRETQVKQVQGEKQMKLVQEQAGRQLLTKLTTKFHGASFRASMMGTELSSPFPAPFLPEAASPIPPIVQAAISPHTQPVASPRGRGMRWLSGSPWLCSLKRWILRVPKL